MTFRKLNVPITRGRLCSPPIRYWPSYVCRAGHQFSAQYPVPVWVLAYSDGFFFKHRTVGLCTNKLHELGIRPARPTLTAISSHRSQAPRSAFGSVTGFLPTIRRTIHLSRVSAVAVHSSVMCTVYYCLKFSDYKTYFARVCTRHCFRMEITAK